jgi:hypothetical protein
VKFTSCCFTLFLLFSNLESDFIPPGTLKINNVYVDKTEILNIHWLEYVHWRSMDLDSITARKNFPDSSNFWYAYPQFRNNPVTGITYEQAVDYCKWRSEMVKKKSHKNVTYRLPTPDEWRAIADYQLASNPEKVEADLLKAKEKIAIDSTGYTLFECGDAKEDIYHLFDNVSEMTAEKGIAMGANNFELVPAKQNLTRKIKYTGSNSYLGFRCIAVVEK